MVRSRARLDPIPETEAETSGDGGDQSLPEQPTRRRIVEELDKRPGLNKRRLCDHLDLYMSQVDRHVERLKDQGWVVTRPGARDREVLVFRREDEDLWENERTRVLYGRSSTRRVGLFLARNPGSTSREIAEAVDLTPVTVRHHLRILRNNDLAAHIQAGQSHEYHPSNELRDWAHTTGRHFAPELREGSGHDGRRPEGSGHDGD